MPAPAINSSSLSGLSSLFVKHGLIDEQQISTAQQQAKNQQQSLISHLVHSELASAHDIAELLHQEYGTTLYDLSELELDTLDDDILNKKLIEKHNCLPLYKRNNRLYVATSDPTNIAALEDFQFSAGMHTEAILVEEDKLTHTINRLFDLDTDSNYLSQVDEEALLSLDTFDEIQALNEQDDDNTPKNDPKDDAPIVVYLNNTLAKAIHRGASDLHFEPYEHSYRIRFRIDGILHLIAQPPIALASRIAARLKVMAKLDIAERRVPQDGRIKLPLSHSKSNNKNHNKGKPKSIDFRVSTLPTLWGEKIVMRILDSSSAQLGIEKLGFDPTQKNLYQDMLAKPQGMILVTGPTGSGKTVSLYTGLNRLNTEERNISTAEDPVEINLEGVNQVHINLKAGLTFASALRSFLRQDPDVIMVGEIRDLETAEIAIKAAQTGHLVLSTLHTNSAAETLTRLLNMGVPGYNIASSITLIIAQRLTRRLCPHCKKQESIPDNELLSLGFTEQQIDQGIDSFQAIGCEHCSGGYKGRVGIYEMLSMTQTIADTIMQGGNSLDIANQAKKQGMQDLRLSGLLKVIEGVTSLAEINRVTQW
ncbi:type IV-A pilus assembly ATPase PilB [Shewanella surugensis]|uniref:Type IV-A pilus assembly ATPase PilB n=1 Tax=Shewanella surugensis TaxID=212020 RepID=A0ABT0LDH3_9GAMM|nr:type IV-A pilus assembly ATPase PilB [Shewanella surugensis]MCL1125771.1 type IV-A pilus assembly ATPase PilB [Shewanella surugensis]